MRPKKRTWLLIAAIMLAMPLAAVAILRVSRAECFTLTGQVICHVETEKPLVALTFDDGPTELGIDAVLPLLQRYRAKGTFFVVGNEVTPKLVERIVAGGHEIGNHSFSHRRMILRTASFYDEEIRRTDAVLVAAGAPRPRLFRPPYGKKLIGLPLAVERSGKQMVTWKSGEPSDSDPRAYARTVLQQVRPGSIILIHPMFPANQTQRAALPLILEGLTKRGFQMVTVSELIAAGKAVPSRSKH